MTPQAHAGWFSDRWSDIKEKVKDVREDIVDSVKDVVGGALEKSVVYLLKKGKGKCADYLIGLMLKLNLCDGSLAVNIMGKIMQDPNIITDDILLKMMKNKSMISLMGKLIAEKDTQARSTGFFNLSMQRMLPIMMDPNFDINIIYEIRTEAFVIFSNLGAMADNDDALEKPWEVMLRYSMSNPQTAGAMFGMLGQLTPQYQQAMMNFMFLGIDGSGKEHFAQSINFNQAMIEGFATMMESNPEVAGQLLQGLMPMLLTFDDQGNMTGMTPYGFRFMTVLGTKMMTCGNESATALGMACGQMMPGVIPPAFNELAACGRVEDAENIRVLNAGEATFIDSDGDGIPDFMDAAPYYNANASDIDGDGISDANDTDMDGDGILNDEDPDSDGDKILNHDDVDVDGILNIADADADDDGIDGTDDDQNDIDLDGINDESDADDDGMKVRMMIK